MSNQLQPLPLTVQWIPGEKSLMISFPENTIFSDIHSIHFLKNGTDLNLCSLENFKYQIESGIVPDLKGKS